MEQNKYIGITIGPIYDTIHKAEKTREIWGASYLFSYIAKELVKAINKKGNYEILLPSPAAVNVTTPGVGLYPDRILLKIKEGGSLKDINEIVTGVKENVSNQLWKEINKTRFTWKPYEKHIQFFKKNEILVKDFFKNYFKIYVIEANERDLCFIDDKGKKIGIVKSLNLYLDNTEQLPALAHLDPNPFFVLLHFINHSFLIKDAFDSKYKNGFPSLPEIATNELQFVKEGTGYKFQNDIRQIINQEQKNNDTTVEIDDDDSLSKIFKIKNIDKYLRTYHRYVAIVHADGDNMGKLIGSLNDNASEIQKFSQDLLDFAKKANKILAGDRFTKNNNTNWGYGAAPVYIGGDDLVFFAPVASRDEDGNYKTLFDLIAEIDNAFNEIFNKKDTDGDYVKYSGLTDVRPRLTYGISISYYKFPLREAFEISKNLMYEAKADKYKTRNRLNFLLLKHSKQEYKGIIDKNFNNFESFRKLLNSNLRIPKGKDSELFLNSISRKIQENPGQYLDKSIKDLSDLFDNTFNESVHKNFKDYLNEVRKFIESMLNNQGYNESTLETIVSLLKLIHFYRDNEFKN